MNLSPLEEKAQDIGPALADIPDHVANPDPSIYWSNNYVVLDFETTADLKGSPVSPSNRIVLACWRGADGEMHHCRGGEYEQQRLVECVDSADFVVAHNAKFELGWLRRCGVNLRRVVTFDTMIAEYVLGGNSLRPQHLGLDATLARYKLGSKGDTVSSMIKAGCPVENIPEEWLLRYCERDVEATHELFMLQRDELKGRALEAINYQRNLVTPALADIEANGMKLDEEAVLKLEEEKEAEYARLTNRLQEFCGGRNPSSPKQMREFIYGELGFQVPTDHRRQPILTSSGDPSTAAPVLARLVGRTARQRKFLALRGKWSQLHSDLTKYIRKFADVVRNNQGLLYGNFNQTATRTHRLSSTGVGKASVQFQNFNRLFKPLFRARNDGWSVGEADGSQLEFRVAVHLGRDAHQYSADIIGVSRQEAKAHTFKPLYGGTSGSERERTYYDAFKERYSSVFSEQTRWTQVVLKDKKLTTEWGMTYYWPDTKMKRSGYITNSTSIFNYPVQALATAEIIPLVLVVMWHTMEGMQSFIVNTVHDSIITEVSSEERSTLTRLSEKAFTQDVYQILSKLYGVNLTVPLATEVMYGPRWGVKETSVEYQAEEGLWKDAAQASNML